MSEVRRRLAAIVYDGFARHLHTLLPGSHAIRARLADVLCDRVARTASIEPGVRLSRGLTLEDGAGVGAGTWFVGAGRIVLGRRLKMGPQCMFITNDHTIPGDLQKFSEMPAKSADIYVGDDVFLGARTIIMPGVTIGNGVAVGAGSVVTKDLPAGAIAVGSPARILRTREVS